MTAVMVSVADALVTALNAATWSPTFTAVRSYAHWADKLESISSLKVDVVPVNHARSSLATRGSLEYAPEIDIGFRQLLTTTTTAAVDTLVALVESVNEWVCSRDVASTPVAEWESASIRALYVRDHLREWKQFTGIIRVTYRVEKSL